MERIIFCVFLDTDLKIYHNKLSQYFPAECDEDDVDENEEEEEGGRGEEKGGREGENRAEEEEESREANTPVVVPVLTRSVTEPGTVECFTYQ